MKQYLVYLIVVLLTMDVTGQSWQRIQLVTSLPNNTPILIDGAAFGDTCIVADNTGSFIRTTDFFKTFVVDSAHAGKLVHAMSFANSQYGYASSTFAEGGMLTTVDGGLSWNELPFGNSQNSPGDVLYFVKPDTGYVGGTSMYHGIRYTNNGGKLWSNPAILNFECPSIFKIQFVNDSTGYILSSDNPSPPTGFGELHIFKTTNYGQNWMDINKLNYPDFPMGFGDLLFTDDTTAFVTADLVILRSTDGAYSFDTVFVSTDIGNDGFNQHIPAISFANYDTGFVAYAGSVYKTCNAGNTWIKTNFSFSSDDPSNQIWFIKAVSGSKVFVGCQKGTIYKTETGGGVWAGVNETEEAPTFNLYPNPATHQLTIQTTGYNSSYQLTTTTGQLLLQGSVTLPNFTIDVSTLPPGLYFVQLTNGHQRAVRKFVKQ